MCGKKKDLVRIKCYSILSEVKLQIVKLSNAGSLTLHQKNKYPATCWLLAPLKTKLTRIPFISPHVLTHFIVFFASCPCFRFAENFTVGFAIDWVVSRGGDVIVSLLGMLWWNLLSSFQRYCIIETGF